MKLISFLMSLVISFFAVVPAFAQDGPPQFVSDVAVQYGSKIDLTASMTQVDLPLRAVAFLRPANHENTLVVEADIFQDTDLYRFEASISMRPQVFDPFEMLTIWWQVDFADGGSWISPDQEIRYEDNRFPWRTRSDGGISVHWVNGEADFGEKLLDLISGALATIGQTLGLTAPGDIALYIYPSQGDLQTALQLGGAPWIEGHTLPELGVILLASTDSAESMIALERGIPHEITHLLLYERLGESYDHVPAWLGEGLATLQEQQANPAYRFELERAVKENSLLKMDSLCASFPISESDALLAYAQSASFTQYLLDVYGMGGVLQLLDAYKEGVSCTGGVQRIYQRPLSQLEDEWITLHLQAPSLWQKLRPILPWSLLLLLVAIVLIIGIAARNQSSPSQSR